MGGTDDPENIIEVTIEEHAEAHRKLYEEHNHWQDYVAWKGLLGLLTSDECSYLAMVNGGIRGSAISNGGFFYSDGNEIKKFMPWEVPEGWNRVKKDPSRNPGIGSGTKKTKWYHNPNTMERKCFFDHEKIPEGWIHGQGNKKKVKCFWYSNDIEEGQFEIDSQPDGWRRGRIRGRSRDRQEQ